MAVGNDLEAVSLFQSYLETLPIAVYTTDARGYLTFCNQAARNLAGRSPEFGRDRWCVTWRLYSADGKRMAHDACPMAIALKENRLVRGASAIAERPDGSLFRFTPYPTPIRGARGNVTAGINVLAVGSCDDAGLPSQTRVSHDSCGALYAALRPVMALLARARRDTCTRHTFGPAAVVIQRAATLCAAQGAHLELATPGGIEAWDLLSAIWVAAASGLPEGLEFKADAAAGAIPCETAVPLALIARELVDNALRHGRAAGRPASVNATLCHDCHGMALIVEDNGPGFDLRPDHARSVGLGLVMTLSRQIGATFEVMRAPNCRCLVRLAEARTLH